MCVWPGCTSRVGRSRRRTSARASASSVSTQSLGLEERLEETPLRGYHETITYTWLSLVAAARPSPPGETGTRDDASSEAFLARRPDMLDREAPLRCYSRGRLFSLRARTVFVEPDLAPLPMWSDTT